MLMYVQRSDVGIAGAKLYYPDDETVQNMKIIVTGAAGQLGSDVIKEAEKRGHTVIGLDREMTDDLPVTDDRLRPEEGETVFRRIDITDRQGVQKVIAFYRPDAVIHCAAWTAVDDAEESGNRDAVYDINVNATRYIAEACRDARCPMMYISTDYVFDGEGVDPWDPDERDFAPLNYYGESKLGGETAIAEILDKFFVVRTSWVFGAMGNNFVKTMLRVGSTRNEVRVVCDQIGTPTYTPDLAKLLIDIIRSDRYGYYNASNEGGYISWYDFTREIYRQAGLDTEVIPVTTEEYGLSKAMRPKNSRLCKKKLVENGFNLLPAWQDALGRFLKEICHGQPGQL